MKNLKIIFLFVFCCFGKTVHAQSNFDWSEVRFGGSANLGFSNNATNIILAPSTIYPVLDNLFLGASVSFGYSSFRNPSARLFNYGAAALSYYRPIEYIQLSAELEQTFVNTSGDFVRDDFDFLALYLGVGYSVGNATFGVRYDVLYDEDNSLYRSPLSPFVQFYF